MIVYSYYVLDILHDGHLEMLKNSKAIAGMGGRVIVVPYYPLESSTAIKERIRGGG